MRIYYCQCGIRTEVLKDEVKQCECGKVFGASDNPSHHINMRNTWSGQTQVEFSQTTMDEDIAQRNRR
jgi:hypothetical protein